MSNKELIGFGGGGKGGGGGSAMKEEDNTLFSNQYARVLLLVSEGDCAGLANNSKDGKRGSIFLDGTPATQFEAGFSFDERLGMPDQKPIGGFPIREVTIPIGVELKQDNPYIRQINNTNCTSIVVAVGVNGLQNFDKNNNKTTGYKVEYEIWLSTNGGAFVHVENAKFDGKTTGTFEQSHRITLEKASKWAIKVVRKTENSKSTMVSDKTYINYIKEVKDGSHEYPNCAVIGVEINAKYFTSIPQVTLDYQGRMIRVPSNYDPTTNSYSGSWDGTFDTKYSNNPAWCFYDMITHDRYGAGDKVNEALVDKWNLYRIGRYCDEMVDDGNGGKEPRFTCNIHITQAEQAWKQLQNLMSICRGMIYWSNGSAVPSADMPSDPVYTYTQANVIDGRFTYSGTPLSTRFTIARISWIDNTELGTIKVETVEDEDGIRRYGRNEYESTAFACTSQGQARRIGQWIVQTSQKETRAVEFAVGLDGVVAAPSQIIRVADNLISGKRTGGRIKSVKNKKVQLDALTETFVGDKITVTLPSGKVETRTITKVETSEPISWDSTNITFDSLDFTFDQTAKTAFKEFIEINTKFSEQPDRGAVWVLERAELQAQQFRVMGVTEVEKNIFKISAIQHTPSKFKAIDVGGEFDPLNISNLPSRTQSPPTNVKLSSYTIYHQGQSHYIATVSWNVPDNAVEYEVEWRRDNGNFKNLGRTGASSFEIEDIFKGGYVARVRAFNAVRLPSAWAVCNLTELNGNPAPPPKITSLTATKDKVWGIDLQWTFEKTDNIIERTEIWYSKNPKRETATKLTDLAYPTDKHEMNSLQAGASFFFWARVVDKNGMESEFYPKGVGVNGQASSAANAILDNISGKITETQLGQELIKKLDKTGVEVGEKISPTSSLYTIKTKATAPDGTEVSAGLGVGSEILPDGSTSSQVLVAADRFAVVNPNDDKLTSVFAIEKGQTIINNAVIGDASITNAKIGNVIQSNAWTGGRPNWVIDKNQGLEVNKGSIKGTLIEGNTIKGGAINGTTITGVYIKGSTVEADCIKGDIVKAVIVPAVTQTSENYEIKAGVFPKGIKKGILYMPNLRANLWLRASYVRNGSFFSAILRVKNDGQIIKEFNLFYKKWDHYEGEKGYEYDLKLPTEIIENVPKLNGSIEIGIITNWSIKASAIANNPIFKSNKFVLMIL